jgi:hypothetical protein
MVSNTVLLTRYNGAKLRRLTFFEVAIDFPGTEHSLNGTA